MKHNVDGRMPRDVYVAAGAKAACILGNTVAVTALTLDFHERGTGAWAVAGLLAAAGLPIVLLAPLIGWVVDWFDSQTLILVSSLWQAGTCVLLAFVADPRIVLALMCLSSFGSALTNPLFVALTSVLVPAWRLASANSMQQGAVTIAMMAGPAAGGMLTGIAGGARIPLLADAVLFVLVAGAGLLIGTRRRPRREGASPSARGGFAMLFSDHVLAAGVMLAAILPMVIHLIYVAQVFLVRDSFGASAVAFGMLQATQMAGLLVGTIVASRVNTVRRIVLGIPIAATVMSSAIAMIGLSRSLPATFALYLLAGVAMSVVSVSVWTLLLVRVPEQSIGRVTASFTGVHRVFGLIAYGMGGVIVGVLGPETVYLLSGTAALVIIAALLPAFRRAWLLTRPSPRDEELPAEEVGGRVGLGVKERGDDDDALPGVPG